MSEKICCITGHRKIEEDKVEYVKRELRREIVQAIQDGYNHFISGFAEGVDLWFAEIVLELKKDNRSLVLEAAIPYRNRIKSLFDSGISKEMLVQCSIIGVHSEEYQHDCFMKRNRFMVENSTRIIAVYDGREKGDTLFTMREATILERDVLVIEI